MRNHIREFLSYTLILMALLFIDFTRQLDRLFKDTDTIILLGALLYLLFAIIIARAKYKYYGLIAAFMVWTGTACITTSFLSVADPDTSTYTTTFNIIYALFGVFGGIRIYRAWLRYTRSQEEQPPVNDQGEAPDK